MKKYFKKPELLITAVQLILDTPGLKYIKWGDEQFAKGGDWLVNADGNIYTIEKDAFARTYAEVSPGRYKKVTPLYADVAKADGKIATLEGYSHYKAGDYLVYEQPDQELGAYVISKDRFERTYTLAED